MGVHRSGTGRMASTGQRLADVPGENPEAAALVFPAVPRVGSECRSVAEAAPGGAASRSSPSPLDVGRERVRESSGSDGGKWAREHRIGRYDSLGLCVPAARIASSHARAGRD